MYGFKEKAKHLRELHSTAHAEADISLLRRLSPQHKLNKVQFPSRKAEEILFALLDLTTAEAIRDNRKELNLLKEKENEVQSDTTSKSGTEEDTHPLQPEQSGTDAPEQPGTDPEEDTKGGDVNDQSTQDGPVTDAQQTVDPEEHEQLKAELEETKEQLEELEGAAEELEEKTEELESVKEELAAEKKNQPKPKQEPKASTKAKTTKAKK